MLHVSLMRREVEESERARREGGSWSVRGGDLSVPLYGARSRPWIVCSMSYSCWISCSCIALQCTVSCSPVTAFYERHEKLLSWIAGHSVPLADTVIRLILWSWVSQSHPHMIKDMLFLCLSIYLPLSLSLSLLFLPHLSLPFSFSIPLYLSLSLSISLCLSVCLSVVSWWHLLKISSEGAKYWFVITITNKSELCRLPVLENGLH